jgi:hypothetical protein
VADMTGQVRLAVALAHALPAGTVELHTADGSVLQASHDPEHGAPLTPCDVRAALLARECPALPSVTARIVDVVVHAPDLVDLGGGLYGRTCSHGSAQRWFATFLAPGSVSRLLDECPLDMPELLAASLRPDVELGVVIAVLSSDAPEMTAILDDASRWASAACFTQELLHAVQHASDAS